MEKYKFKYKGKEYELVEGEHKLKNHCDPCCFKEGECIDIKKADCIREGIHFKHYFKEVKHKDKKLNLNHIQEYKQFSDKVNFKGQMIKVREEFKEFSNEIYKSDYDLDTWAVIDEGLDLIVATFNLISKLGLTQEQIDKHKKKLEGYKNSGKH